MNIPLMEALEHMSGYVRFIKDLVKKKKMVSFELVDNVHHYSEISYRSLVEKKEDTEDFTIPYTIGYLNFVRVLYDLGASINLMTLPFTSSWG